MGDVLLLTDADHGIFQRIPLGNEDLALHDIDIGDELRDGVFYLYTGVDFDEIEMLLVLVNEEFARPCIDVVDVLHQLDCGVADLLAEETGRDHAGAISMTF